MALKIHLLAIPSYMSFCAAVPGPGQVELGWGVGITLSVCFVYLLTGAPRSLWRGFYHSGSTDGAELDW